MSSDPFRGALEDGNPRDPANPWYKDSPMAPERLAQILTEILKDRGVEGYLIRVELVNQSSQASN